MWWLLVGIIILFFSAFFGAYLVEFYTSSFKVATFAKATSITLFFIGIIILFVTVGWWGLAGIVGYWLFFMLSRVHWHKRFETRLEAGTDPGHGKVREKELSDDE